MIAPYKANATVLAERRLQEGGKTIRIEAKAATGIPEKKDDKTKNPPNVFSTLGGFLL